MNDLEARAQALASIRSSPASLAEVLSGGKWVRTDYLEWMSDIFVAAARGDIDNAVIMMPPRHGKSELGSHWLPVWYLNEHPEHQVLLGSYEATFAAKWGKKVRDTIEAHQDSLRVRISRDSRAKHRWTTSEGGGMITAGVGGPFTGEGGNIILIDDPFKNFKQASSQLYRDEVWDWFTHVAITRREPGCSIIVIMTRWHEDDLIGRLLGEGDFVPSEDENAATFDWEVFDLPALAEEGDPLGREVGEALWPERYDELELEKIKSAVGSLAFSGMYQQKPAREEGEMFKKSQLREFYKDTSGALTYVLIDPDYPEPKRVLDSKCVKFSTLDLAITKKETSDYTVLSTWALTPDQELLLLDVERIKQEAPDHRGMVRRNHQACSLSFTSIESTQYQLSLVQELRRGNPRKKIPPTPVREFRPKGDKIARAREAQVFMEGGGIYVARRADWRPTWDREIFRFPRSKHDDQVDTLSMAVIEVVNGGVGAATVPTGMLRSRTKRDSPIGR